MKIKSKFYIVFLLFIFISLSINAETLEDRLNSSNQSLISVNKYLIQSMKSSQNNEIEFNTLNLFIRDINSMMDMNNFLSDIYSLTNMINDPKDKKIASIYFSKSKNNYIRLCEEKVKNINQLLIFIKTTSIVNDSQKGRDIIERDCSFVNTLK